jgi:hypothetical protein
MNDIVRRPFLVPWSFTLGARIQVFAFISTVQYAIIGTRMDFFNLEADGQARTLAGANYATVQGLQSYRASRFTHYTK